jgi:hypothetical protein
MPSEKKEKGKDDSQEIVLSVSLEKGGEMMYIVPALPKKDSEIVDYINQEAKKLGLDYRKKHVYMTTKGVLAITKAGYDAVSTQLHIKTRHTEIISDIENQRFIFDVTAYIEETKQESTNTGAADGGELKFVGKEIYEKIKTHEIDRLKALDPSKWWIVRNNAFTRAKNRAINGLLGVAVADAEEIVDLPEYKKNAIDTKVEESPESFLTRETKREDIKAEPKKEEKKVESKSNSLNFDLGELGDLGSFGSITPVPKEDPKKDESKKEDPKKATLIPDPLADFSAEELAAEEAETKQPPNGSVDLNKVMEKIEISVPKLNFGSNKLSYYKNPEEHLGYGIVALCISEMLVEHNVNIAKFWSGTGVSAQSNWQGGAKKLLSSKDFLDSDPDIALKEAFGAFIQIENMVSVIPNYAALSTMVDLKTTELLTKVHEFIQKVKYPVKPDEFYVALKKHLDLPLNLTAAWHDFFGWNKWIKETATQITLS